MSLYLSLQIKEDRGEYDWVMQYVYTNGTALDESSVINKVQGRQGWYKYINIYSIGILYQYNAFEDDLEASILYQYNPWQYSYYQRYFEVQISQSSTQIQVM